MVPQRKPTLDRILSKLFLVFDRKAYISHGGNVYSGKMTTEEVIIDEKGRILIPKKTREKIGLQAGGKARLKVDKATIVILPPISPEEFIREMEGCIEEGAPTIDPLELKKMWEPKKVAKK